MTIEIVGYLYVAFWTAIIASACKGVPRSRLGLVLGCIVLGLVWPASLPAFVIFDLPERTP